MKKTFLRTTYWVLFLYAAACFASELPFSPSETSGKIVLVRYESPEGRILESNLGNYSQVEMIARHWRSQYNFFNCAPTSAVIVLNALGVSHSGCEELMACNFLNAKTDLIKPSHNIEPSFGTPADHPDPGLSLVDLNRILAEVYLIRTKKIEVSDRDVGIDLFRSAMREALSSQNKFVIANFRGKTLGAPTGGHFSPIAGYNEAQDYLLVADVASHRNPWYWAPVSEFYAGMQGRGYLVVGPK